MRSSMLAFSVLALAICLAPGCSSGSGDGGMAGAAGSGSGGVGGGSGQCPNLAGTWTIQSHCSSSQVGAQVSLTQTACTVTDDDGTSISLGSDGSFAYNSTTPDGTPINCTGTATASTITESCNIGGQQCNITLAK